MSLDTAQNASAITDLILAGLKVTGYSVVTICSVLGSHTIKYYWDQEERMKETVARWRYVLSHLTETQKDEIGPSSLSCMIRKLDQYVRLVHRAQLIGIYALTLTIGWKDS